MPSSVCRARYPCWFVSSSGPLIVPLVSTVTAPRLRIIVVSSSECVFAESRSGAALRVGMHKAADSRRDCQMGFMCHGERERETQALRNET
jgi:hypothetical protein